MILLEERLKVATAPIATAKAKRDKVQGFLRVRLCWSDTKVFGSCLCYARKATNRTVFLQIFYHVDNTERHLLTECSYFTWIHFLVLVFYNMHAEQMMQQKGKPEVEQAQYRTKLDSLSAQVLVLESAANTGELQAQKRCDTEPNLMQRRVCAALP